MHSRGCTWQVCGGKGACVVGEGRAWQGACVEGGFCFNTSLMYICIDICDSKSAHRKIILTLHCPLQTEFDLAGAYLAFC